MAAAFSFVGVFLHIIPGLLAFNLDTNIPLVKKSNNPNSYFGFSVAEHRIPSLGAIDGSVLLIGAPNDTLQNGPVPQTGVVYKCPITTLHSDCTQLGIGAQPQLDDEDKEGGWLGVTVKSVGKKVLACAHRYRKLNRIGRRIESIRGEGICYILYNTLDEDEEQFPCTAMPSEKGHEQYGFCQAGMSGVLTKDDRVIIGTPGPVNWRGAIFKNSISDSLDADKKWYSPDDMNPPVDIYSYLGYSVTAGKFLDDEMTYVAGAPRANQTGQVVFFRENKSPKYLRFEPQHILKGEQFGSFFGAEVLAIDLNKDGLLDLVVGAPFYYKPLVGGKIYVYMNSNPQGITDKTVPIEIQSRAMNERECTELGCEHARFGFSLANLGDVNRDGFDDLAVGAPYEGNGTVYIFNGGKDGIKKEFSQRIRASDIKGAAELKSFGYSLSGGVDMDHNGYPDLLVGAYDSNYAILLRARPVVNLYADFSSQPKMVNPKITNCADGKGLCFKLNLCFKFTAEPRDKFATITPTINYKIVAEKYKGGYSFSRVIFKNAANNDRRFEVSGSLDLYRQFSNQMKCISQEAFLDSTTKDLLNPINFQITYGLKEDVPPALVPGQPLPEINKYPTYNQKDAKRMFMLDFEKNCGRDNVCRSHLKLNYMIDKLEREAGDPNKYILNLGEHSEIMLKFNIKNKKEDAHAAEFHIWHPADFKYRQTEGIICNRIEGVANYRLCKLGNPLNEGQSKDFGVIFYTYGIKNSDKDLRFNFTVNTTSTDASSNVQHSMTVRVVVKTDILIRGGSSPEQVFYGGKVVGESAIKVENEIGSPLVHSYEVINTGHGTVPAASVDILWPYEVENGLENGKHLLYLMQEPKVEGVEGKCEMQQGQVNPLNIAGSVDTQSPPSYTIAGDGSKTRKKRALRRIEPEEVTGPGGKKMKVVTLDCDARSSGYSTAKCFKFTCRIGTLLKLKRAIIRIRARLWNSTFIEDYPDVDSVRILSKARVILNPKDNIEQERTDNDEAYALTIAYPEHKESKKEEVPLWIIIVAAIGGVLLLLLLILILWLLGFFKRKTVMDQDVPPHSATLQTKNDVFDMSGPEYSKLNQKQPQMYHPTSYPLPAEEEPDEDGVVHETRMLNVLHQTSNPLPAANAAPDPDDDLIIHEKLNIKGKKKTKRKGKHKDKL